MTVTLACAWQVRGELPRLRRLFPQIAAIYSGMVIALNADAGTEVISALDDLPITHTFYDEWSGRHDVMRLALRTRCEHVHYVDMDRLLRWAETRPEELQWTVERLQGSDCLIIGRTPAAWATHPQCMIQTEYLPNRFFSHMVGLGSSMDFGAGSKGFSHQAVTFILRNDPAGIALNMDIAWPILLRRGGFSLDYVEVDGLDYESADQQQPQAADRAAQQQLADKIDADPKKWALRVRIAQDMTDAALAAQTTPLIEKD